MTRKERDLKDHLPTDWTLEQIKDFYIQHILTVCGGVKQRAASVLGVDRKTIYRKRKQGTIQ
jgi:DNA-binding NtrC family response regulator